MERLRRNLFLIDGVGALLSAAMLGLALPRWNVGVPTPVLEMLAFLALGLAAVSLSCFAAGRRGGLWLRAIAVANALYCVATAWIVVSLFGSLTPFGVAYFTGEMGLILALAGFEWVSAGRR